VQSFTARVPLLVTTSAFRLGEDAGVFNSVIFTVSIPYFKNTKSKILEYLQQALTGQMPFQSPNQQHQCTKGKEAPKN